MSILSWLRRGDHLLVNHNDSCSRTDKIADIVASQAVVEQQHIGLSKKREAGYKIWSPEKRVKMVKYACLHGNASASRYLFLLNSPFFTGIYYC